MPTAQKPEAIALLKADHRKVEELFEKFESASGAARKQALAKEICTELCVHATIEEEIFYPACKGKIEEDTLDEAYVEHDGAKVMIAELLAGSPDDDFYDAKMKSPLGGDQTPREGRRATRGPVRPGQGGRRRYAGTGRAAGQPQKGTAGPIQGRRAAAAHDARLHRP